VLARPAPPSAAVPDPHVADGHLDVDAPEGVAYQSD
jgi:hypothetical protein